MPHYHRKWLTGLIAGLAHAWLIAVALSAERIEYVVNLDAPQTQMVEISMTVRDIRPDETHVDFVLPTWRPGRYVILDPAGTVRDAWANDPDDGSALEIRKIDKTTWRVTTAGARSIRMAYRIYANSLGDRTRHVDDSHAFLSGSSVFMFNPQRRDGPVRITFDMPTDWDIATGLDRDEDSNRRAVVAPNYDVLVDSPIEVGRHDRLAFEARGKTYEIVIWPTGIAYDGNRLIDDFRKIIEAAEDVFGPMPYERYVFLMHVGAGAGGGTEHLNSTVMQTSRGNVEESIDNTAAYKRFLGLVSHEFIHTWNVKLFRPAGLSPYDYVHENYTTLLWVAEGTTSYYSELLRVRAGYIKPGNYLDDLASSINSDRNRPGSQVQSLAESSFDAWIKFNRSSPDDVNTEVSIYGKGALASALIDLELRKRTDNNASLDDVMRAMAARYRWPGPGYTPEDFQGVIEETAGYPFDDFFERFINGTETLAFDEALHDVGLELYFKPDASRESDDPDDASDEKAERDDDADLSSIDSVPLKPYLGLDLVGLGGFSRVRAVRSDGPAYSAGLIVDDEILAMDGRRLQPGDLDDRLKRLKVGDVVHITFMRRDELRSLDVPLIGKPAGAWRIRKVSEPTESQKAGYASWLGHSWD